jgi:hypothetical protein
MSMPDQAYPVYDIRVRQRGRRWWWSVWTTERSLLMAGFTRNRPAARYEAHKALFLLLLSAPHRSRRSTRTIRAYQEARARYSPKF